MNSGLADFIKTTNARRIAVRGSIRFAIVSVIFIVAISLFLFMAQVDINTLFGKVIVMIAMLWVTVLLISGRSWFIGSTLLAREVNMALVPILANTFNRTLLYTYNESAVDSVRDMLNESGLVTDKVTTIKVKNIYTVFSEVDMRVHEIAFGQNDGQSRPKSTNYTAVFIDVNLSQEAPTQTAFSTVGSKYGFAHDTFVKYLQTDKHFSPSKNTSEALAVFTADKDSVDADVSAELLQSLQEWGSEAKVNIRAMRTGSKLYILVPASKESITYTSTSTKQESIERYASLVAQPIWHALMLTEEV